jgi:SAM-dependent methyltransferase
MNNSSFITQNDLHNPTMQMIKEFEQEKKLTMHNHFNINHKIINLEQYALFFNKNSNLIEFGTKRSDIKVKTSHEDLFNNQYATYTKTDFQNGVDVDIVADIHTCSNQLGLNKYDGIVCMSVFEHVKRPWIACNELFKILKSNGYVYISTHQTFPLHGYPSDYFRFSVDALKLIMEDAGFTTITCFYNEPCSIIPENISTIYPNWNYLAESYMFVNYVGQKK